MNGEALTISELGQKTNVNIATLRYYERRGLLPSPPRSASNYRLFPQDAVKVVRFIKRAQELGFSLKEIEDLLSLRAIPEARCVDIQNLAKGKIKDIDTKMSSLKAIRDVLAAVLIECPGQAPIQKCPILEAIDAEEEQ